jgi:hypothetical protein
MAVLAYSSAGTIAEMLGAVERTGHAGTVKDTLTAHLAVKDRLFADFLHSCHQGFCPTSWFEPAFEWVKADLKKVIEEF